MSISITWRFCEMLLFRCPTANGCKKSGTPSYKLEWKKVEMKVVTATSWWRTLSASSSLLLVFGKPAGVGPLRVLLLSGRAYTLPDVPREFYPRRSATSTHFPHLPDMRHSRGERAEKTARRSAVYLYTFFCVCFWRVDLIHGTNFPSRCRDRNRQQ